MFNRTGRTALTISLGMAVLRLYRLLLRQFFLNLMVIARFTGLIGRMETWPGLILGSLHLVRKALRPYPMLMVFRFFIEKKEREPFIPSPGTPVTPELKSLLAPPRPLIPLTHSGVIKLQEAVTRRELKRRLDVSLSEGSFGSREGPGKGPGACTDLGRFGGVDRILSSLLTAAGGRRAMVSKEELAHRLEVVLPSFLQVLGMQGRMDLQFPEPGRSRNKGFPWFFHFCEFKKGIDKKKQLLIFSQPLYPTAIEEARGRIIRENRLHRWRSHIHHLDVLREEYRFGLYTATLDVLHRLNERFDPGDDRLVETVERLSWNYDN